MSCHVTPNESNGQDLTRNAVEKRRVCRQRWRAQPHVNVVLSASGPLSPAQPAALGRAAYSGRSNRRRHRHRPRPYPGVQGGYFLCRYVNGLGQGVREVDRGGPRPREIAAPATVTTATAATAAAAAAATPDAPAALVGGVLSSSVDVPGAATIAQAERRRNVVGIDTNC